MVKISKKKTQDLKLTSDELKDLQSLVSALNKLRLQVGELEIQKSGTLQRFENFRGDLNKMELGLRDKYGQVSININDGILTEIPAEDETNKKN